MLRRIASGLAGTSAVSLGYLFYPKRKLEPEEGTEPYQLRGKIEDISSHPNSHFITRTPKKICIIGAGISGC